MSGSHGLGKAKAVPMRDGWPAGRAWAAMGEGSCDAGLAEAFMEALDEAVQRLDGLSARITPMPVDGWNCLAYLVSGTEEPKRQWLVGLGVPGRPGLARRPVWAAQIGLSATTPVRRLVVDGAKDPKSCADRIRALFDPKENRMMEDAG